MNRTYVYHRAFRAYWQTTSDRGCTRDKLHPQGLYVEYLQQMAKRAKTTITCIDSDARGKSEVGVRCHSQWQWDSLLTPYFSTYKSFSMSASPHLGQLAAIEVCHDFRNACSCGLWGDGHHRPGRNKYQRQAVRHIEKPCYKQVGVLYEVPAHTDPQYITRAQQLTACNYAENTLEHCMGHT